MVALRPHGACWNKPHSPRGSNHLSFVLNFDADDLGGQGHFYETIDFELAMHPQTLLAYAMNGAPLAIPHGAPLRLRVETQLGFKMVKYLRAIEFAVEYEHLGKGQGGWREDVQFYSQEAGI